MTDNLRDRIAWTLLTHQCGLLPGMKTGNEYDWHWKVADAVIEALGLEKEVRYGEPKAYTVDSKSVRYVTEWETDENL